MALSMEGSPMVAGEVFIFLEASELLLVNGFRHVPACRLCLGCNLDVDFLCL